MLDPAGRGRRNSCPPRRNCASHATSARSLTDQIKPATRELADRPRDVLDQIHDLDNCSSAEVAPTGAASSSAAPDNAPENSSDDAPPEGEIAEPGADT
ncbi:MAG: hypothetical protein AAF503_08855 [Pseudomonadota bacterium]